VPIPTACISPAFTSGPLGELTLANTAEAGCPWPLGQFNSCNGLRYDPDNGLWAMPAGLPAPPGSSSALPIEWSSQGGSFSSPVSWAEQSAIYQPSSSDPAFTTGPSAPLKSVTLTNPSSVMNSGFLGWAEWYMGAVTNSSDWWELWVSLNYPGALWPTDAYWDSSRSIAPAGSIVAHLRTRRSVVFTATPGEMVTVSPMIGARNLANASGGSTAAQIDGWSWVLFGMWFTLDPIAQG
jgi:hypothetical protein